MELNNERRAPENEVLLHISAVIDPQNPEAYEDPLTGLYNRRGFDMMLQHVADTMPGNFAIFAIDLDGMKDINESQGHAAGDELLQRTAQTLTEELRTPTDVISLYRTGGDEFWVLCPGVSNEAMLSLISNRLDSGFARNKVEASIGGAVHEVGMDLGELMQSADDRARENKINRKLITHSHKQLDAMYQAGQLAEEHDFKLRDLIALWPVLKKSRQG